MSSATVTLIGLYDFDNSIFENATFPAGIDKQTVINTILVNYGELEPLYNSPVFLKFAITNWANKWQWTFNKWNTAINIKYDPLFNYDRYEEFTEEKDGSGSVKTGGTNTSTDTGDTTTEQNVSAYNASTYQPKEQQIVTDNTTNTITIDNASESSEKEKIKHNAHLFGNIGVMSSQSMLSSELEVAKFNLYNNIADIFAEELLLTVFQKGIEK